MSVIHLCGYKFVSLDALPALKTRLEQRARALALKGTILLSSEGINIAVAGAEQSTQQLQHLVQADSRFADLRFKRSRCAVPPFGRLLVKIRKEIITSHVPGLDPEGARAPAIGARELRRWLDEGREVVLLDARNAFEFAAGSFDNAVDLGLRSFGEFAAAAARLDSSFKHKTIVTFCTGGIRCEKAAPLLIAKGFSSVFQLDGGILQYFEECGAAHFRGRCFVFDGRNSLDANLQPAPADKQ